MASSKRTSNSRFIVEQDHLLGREQSDLYLRQADLDKAAACGHDHPLVLGSRVQPRPQALAELEGKLTF